MSGKDDKISFGASPKMLEVPLGGKAKLRFNGKPEIVETEWGEKYSFPITLLSHDSYDSFPINCDWESKCMVAKELYHEYVKDDKKAPYIDAYNNSEWELTRFDNGAYWISQL